MRHAAQSLRHLGKLYMQTYLNIEFCRNLLNMETMKPRTQDSQTGLLLFLWLAAVCRQLEIPGSVLDTEGLVELVEKAMYFLQYRKEEGRNLVFREHPGTGAGRTEQKSMEMGVIQTIDYRQVT